MKRIHGKREPLEKSDHLAQSLGGVVVPKGRSAPGDAGQLAKSIQRILRRESAPRFGLAAAGLGDDPDSGQVFDQAARGQGRYGPGQALRNKGFPSSPE